MKIIEKSSILDDLEGLSYYVAYKSITVKPVVSNS